MFNNKRLLLVLAVLFLWTSPANATFTLVQHTSASCSSCTSLSITVTSTGAGHLLVLTAGGTNGGTGNLSTVSNGGTWTIDTGCAGGNGTVFVSNACAYVLSSSSGATSISVTMSVSNNWRMVFLEYSFTGSSVAFDTSNHINHNSASTSQVGPAITLTGTNDAIVQFLSMSGSSVVTSINQSYVIENTSSGSGQAHSAADLINTTSNTAPTWTTGSSNSECSAIAFKETGGGAPPGCKNGVTLLGVGC